MQLFRSMVQGLGLALVLAGAAQAQTLSPVDQGRVNRSSSGVFGLQISHDPADTSLRVRNFAFGAGVGSASVREDGYLLFEVPADLPPLAAAVLRLSLDNDSPLTGQVSAFDVLSARSAFEVTYTASNDPAAIALVADLEGGALYGSAALTSGAGLTVELALSAQALTDLQAARAGVFGIGLAGGLGAAALGAPASFGAASLVLTPVPEPGTSTLALLGGTVLAVALRRRRRA